MSHLRFFSALAFLLLACSVACPCPAIAQDAAATNAVSDDDYRLGLGHYKQKRWQLAGEHLRAFLKAQPRDTKAASARLLLGVSLTHLKKYREARAELKRFVTDFPRNRSRSEAFFRIGECSYLLADLPVAITDLTAYLQASPKHNLRDWGQFYLADALLRQKKYTAAEAVYRRSLTEFPKGNLVGEIRFGLAMCCEQTGKAAEARRLYLVISGDRSSPFADKSLSQLGSLEFDAKHFAEAARAWNQLSRLFPKSRLAATAQLNAGYAHFQLGQFPEAIARFQAARRKPDQAAVADYWRGISLKSLDRTDEAIAAFRQAEAGRPETTVARDIQFQWADTDFRAGRYELASKRFLEIVTRWPKHPNTAQGMLFATESVLQLAARTKDATLRRQKLEQAQQLVDRFSREFRQPFSSKHQLQAGRLQLARGGNENLKAAITSFRSVLARESSEKIRNRARYQLARAANRLGDDKLVLQTLTPLLDSINKSTRPGEFDDALVLAASSFLAAGRPKLAAGAAANYLKKQPKGTNTADALATLVEASAQQGNAADADRALARLVNDFAGSPLYGQTVHRLAERAYKAKDFKRSERLFGTLVALGPRSPSHAVGLSGQGWSLFETKRYAEAAEVFAKVVELHPKDDLAAEAAYKSAESYERAGNAPKAAAAFQLVARSYGMSSFAFLAARRGARLLTKQKKIDEADKAYSALLEQFPKAKNRDTLLYEWAGLHADAGDFKSADGIYRRLISELPRSSLADDARFALAESDLVAGRLDVASDAFKALIDDRTADDEIQQDALYRLVGIAADRDLWPKVREFGRQLRTRFPRSRHGWEVRFQLGQAALHLGEFTAAKTELTAVLEQRTHAEISQASWFDETWVLLAESHFRLKDYDALVRTVADFRRTRPKSRVLHKADEILGRGHVKKSRPDFDMARAAFRRVINSASGRKTKSAARSHLQLADSFFLQKNYREAKKEFLAVQILYKFPEIQAPALFQAAACQEQLKEWNEAVKTYELLIRQFPSSDFATRAKQRLPDVRRLTTP